MQPLIRVLIVPPDEWRACHTAILTERLGGLPVTIKTAQLSQVLPPADIVLVVLGGRRSNFRLLKDAGVDARRNGSPIHYAYLPIRKLALKLVTVIHDHASAEG